MADNEPMYVGEMYVGDKRVHIGDHVRVVKAHSLLYYEYGMSKEKSECPEYIGIEGTVLCPSDYNDYSACMIKVHNPLLATRFDRGEMRLFKEDEIQILDKENERWT